MFYKIILFFSSISLSVYFIFADDFDYCIQQALSSWKTTVGDDYIKYFGYIYGEVSERDVKIVRNQHVSYINVCRSWHHGAPLIVNELLNEYAQAWANHIAIHEDFKHGPNGNAFGENLAAEYNCDLYTAGFEAALRYYTEFEETDEFFNFHGEESDMMKDWKINGHATTMIWHNNKEIGVGVALANKIKWRETML
ncbi:Golgi-associated plant pathogenesis-related protein 1-like [Daktulosphaira vitifoliae]|uniref:Golgi-associated plant pathogenesis-related protein 1-like n=1 Tax=Daktulosphaira vitifoliae TaxID=58002 RepID=UPI0021AA574C|nr:Golgi-associated plant pathogenesis-related protein 1-like [Daktulosphaira vitifoliae]